MPSASNASLQHPLSVGPVGPRSLEQIKRIERIERIEQHMEFAGPIPSPKVFGKYAEVIPDAPERILRVFEQDSQHTRDMQMTALAGDISRDGRAQWMAFAIMIAALGVTTAVIILGKNITAGIITSLGTLFLSLRVLFVGKKKESNESSPDEEYKYIYDRKRGLIVSFL